VADACEHAERTAEQEIGEAIPPRLFRPCVLEATNQRRRFEPEAHNVANQPLEARESSAHERRQFPGMRAAIATRYVLVANIIPPSTRNIV
jgi:class 3 adenylate cyclase